MNEQNPELFERFLRLQWLLQRLQFRRRAESGPMADTTRGQGRILAMLKLQDGISTKDLSYLMGIQVSSLNELLAKMDKTGYITREPSPADRRIMLVKLTEKGRNEPQQQEWNPEEIFSCLSEDDRTSFARNLDAVIASIEAEIGVDEGEDCRSWWMNGGRDRAREERYGQFMAMGRGPAGDFDPRQRFGGFPRGGMGGNMGGGPTV